MYGPNNPFVVLTQTITATGVVGSTILLYPFSKFSIHVKATGVAATAWDIRLEASLDGTSYDITTNNWILQHTNVDADNTIKHSVNSKLAKAIRINVSGLTLAPATNLVITVVATR